MTEVLNLGFLQVATAYVFTLIVLGIIRVRGIKREKEVVISTFRMTLQLILAGYILGFVFDNPSPLLTIISLLVMEGFAIYVILRRFKGQLTTKLKKVIAFSIVTNTLLCTCFFVLAVVRVGPWYSPQYFIPISGMIIGNSLTAVTLGVNSLLREMNDNKDIVMESLILGGSPKVATRKIINNSFDVAIMPTINNMLSMGIVVLPGMMTGQILSGTSPTVAITYQITIMLAILGAAALSIITLLQLGYKSFFNEEQQLN
jgi:putative ABC transport system permease protein